jgi:DNA primase catalytic core
MTQWTEVVNLLRKEIPLDKLLEDEGLELIKTSTGHRALCPFHQDSNPSFSVNEYQGVLRYYCFGCHAKGDVVGFVRQKYSFPFEDAISYLASKYNISIQLEALSKQDKQRVEFCGIQNKVVEWLGENFIGEKGRAYEYMVSERFRMYDHTDDVLERFKIGYCRSSKDLLQFVYDNKFSTVTGLEYDRGMLWNDVLVFPIINARNEVIGFYNRPFAQYRETRYMSTSSSHVLYSEEEMVFGFNLAIQSELKHELGLIAVEGQVDCVAMHLEWYDNTFALGGTKLNQQIINLLIKHGIKKLTVIFDGDQAGVEAAYRLATQPLKLGTLELNVIVMDDGDPAEFIKGGGAIANILERATLPRFFYISKRLLEAFPNGIEPDIQTFASFLNSVADFVSMFKGIDRAMLIRFIHERVNILNEEYIDDYIYMVSSEDVTNLYNVQVEASLIKQCIEDEDNIIRNDVFIVVSHLDFYSSAAAYIFRLMNERIINESSISYDYLIHQAKIDHRESVVKYLDSIRRSNKIIDHRFCVDDILDKARRRRVLDVAESIQRRATDQQELIASVTEEGIGRLSNVMAQGEVLTKAEIYESAERLHEERCLRDTTILGQPFGYRWPMANNILSGMEIGKALLISGATGHGKTILTLNFAVDWTTKIPNGVDPSSVLILPLEMSKEDLIFRAWAIDSGVGETKIRRGLPLTKDEAMRLAITKEIMKEFGPIIVQPRASTLSAILHEINYWIHKANIKYAVVDYIQRIQMCELTKDMQDWQRIDFAAQMLCDRAQTRGDIGVVVVSQLGDDARKGGVEVDGGTSRARTIDNHFDAHIKVYKKTLKQIQTYGAQKGNRFIKFDKTRFGDGGVIHAHMFNQINPDNDEYGSLRMGEISGLSEEEKKEIKIREDDM